MLVVGTDLLERVDVLGGDAQFDLCTTTGQPAPDGDGSAAGLARAEKRYRHGDIQRHIALVQHPTKGPMPVLKLLQTNACAKDCFYCPFRAGREFRREAIAPEELAGLTSQLYRAGMIRGLFLSSGVIGHGDHAMAQIVDTAEILRAKHGFSGYLHLKIMPHSSDAAIERAVQLADRVSINLEAPNAARLGQLSSTKDFEADLLAPLAKAAALAAQQQRHVSQTTQFVVGAAGESDAEILTTSERLYSHLKLARIYYSAFRPVRDTPLDGQPAEDPVRERRLYQADFLLRDYGFHVPELPLDAAGRLRTDVDPKLAWAQAHPEWFPIEVNRAARAALMRVPGLGTKAVAAILAARRQGVIREAADLRRLGIATERVLPWVTLNGRRAPFQLRLPGAERAA
jgi:predicted DNA-binding helix-hairpin-helix protein